MNELDRLLPWVAVALLGAFHGLNPAMGWLFAVALGLQEGQGRAVLVALGPIALGHALAIGLVAIPVGLLGLVIAPGPLLALGGVALLAFAAMKVVTRFRHPRWVGMRVGPPDLVLWSFLMATAHGAGLMLAPVVALLVRGDRSTVAMAAGHAGHMGPMAAPGGLEAGLAPALTGTAVHTGAMLLVMAVIAMVVFRVLGVELLRRAWINLDWLWAGALAIAGLVSLGFGVVMGDGVMG